MKFLFPSILFLTFLFPSARPGFSYGSGDPSGKEKTAEGQEGPQERLNRIKEEMDKFRRENPQSGQGGGGGGGKKFDLDRIVANITSKLGPEKQAEAVAYLEKMTREWMQWAGSKDREWHRHQNDEGLRRQQRAAMFEKMRPLYDLGVFEGMPIQDAMREHFESRNGARLPPADVSDFPRDVFGPSPETERLRYDSYMEANRPSDAARAAADWVLMDPQNPDAHVALAKSRYDMGDYRTARESGLRALDLEPRNQNARTLVKLTAGYDRPTAAAAPPPAAAGRPAAPYGVYEEPLRETNPIVSGPSSADLRSAGNMAARAYTQFQQKDYAAASASARRALGLDSRNLKAHYANVFALLGLKDYGGALGAVDEALKRDPDNSKFLTARAKILNMLGKYDMALESADRAISADGANGDAYFQKAWANDGARGPRERTAQALEDAARRNARYRDYAERFEGFSEGELAALLSGEDEPRDEKPESRTGGAWAGLGENRRLVMLGLASVVGGFLIALGFLRSASSGAKELFRRAAAFFGRESPAVREDYGAPAAEAAGGALLRNYEVEREIGNGGMGVVYVGRDKTLDRKVAIKRMRDEIRCDARERERFVSEARTVATLHHPNIVEIFSIVEDGYDAFLIFEYVDGATVHDVLRRKKRLPFSEAVGVLRGACAALDYAHAKGVIHRDLKPSNIMISSEGMVKVMDFGVARLAKDSMTRLSRTNTVVGTPPYMAPEQEQGLVRKASDVYALGVMLYEMVTGQLPFQGVGAGMLMAKINKTYVPAGRLVSGLPEGFDSVLDAVLDPDPARRIPGGGELLRRLEALAVAR